MSLLFPDVVRVEVVVQSQLDELAGRTVGPPQREAFDVAAQLDPTQGQWTDRSDAGGLDMQRYRMQVRQADWKRKDPRATKRPKPGDHVTGVRKKFALSTDMEPLDLYVQSLKPVATGAGSFGAWEVMLADRAPQ